MIIIIGAMSEELSQLKNDLNLKKVIDSKFDEYINDQKNLVLALTGIGMTNAAAKLSYLLTKYQNVEYIFNLGTAGCISRSLNRGDFVVVEKAIFSTADSTGFGYDYGQLPNMPKYYSTDLKQRQKLIKILTKLNQNFILGNTATSDMFFESHDKVEQFTNKLPFDVQIAEMEAAAYFQTAYLFNVPIISLKIVSDVIGETNPNEQQFEQFLPVAAKKISIIAQEFLK